ncbi:MAG: hypothetical protein AAF734_11485 [Bacteroidota bacterium]
MKQLYIFGNGNITWENFQAYYLPTLTSIDYHTTYFHVCDFKGADTLAMEFLKMYTGKVTLYHIGERPRYLPDKYKTKVSQWQLAGGYTSDEERDRAAIEACTHYLAIDFNSKEKSLSGTQKNILLCQQLQKIALL